MYSKTSTTRDRARTEVCHSKIMRCTLRAMAPLAYCCRHEGWGRVVLAATQGPNQPQRIRSRYKMDDFSRSINIAVARTVVKTYIKIQTYFVVPPNKPIAASSQADLRRS